MEQQRHQTEEAVNDSYSIYLYGSSNNYGVRCILYIIFLELRAKQLVSVAICWPNFYSLANINPEKPH
jgi:hypothetical protein